MLCLTVIANVIFFSTVNLCCRCRCLVSWCTGWVWDGTGRVFFSRAASARTWARRSSCAWTVRNATACWVIYCGMRSGKMGTGTIVMMGVPVPVLLSLLTCTGTYFVNGDNLGIL